MNRYGLAYLSAGDPSVRCVDRYKSCHGYEQMRVNDVFVLNEKVK